MNNAIERYGSAVVTLPSDREILITRQFDAPARLIFKAYTTPELVRRWWVSADDEWLVCEIDLRVGGRWRYVTRSGGAEAGFHGEYRAIEAPHRLVSTDVYEGIEGIDPDDVAALDTLVLEERDGVTTMTVRVLHVNQQARDMHLAAGMEEGMQLALDRLEVTTAGLR
ncbi:MAG: SRPBCC family protein [Dehalococcoidia bacterium]|mgnify:CR=1 FL=1